MIKRELYSHHQYSLQERENIIATLDNEQFNRSVILQTCNRVEIYHGEGFIESDIVTHLFRVVSGLESRLIGETSIQGQVKQAYANACDKESLDKCMHRLFQQALFVGKKVRTKTGISQGAMSHAQATVDLISRHEADFVDKVISIIGVHKLNESIVQYLIKKGAGTLFIGNRNYERAQQMATDCKGKAFRFEHLKEALSQSDIVISATSAPHLIIKEEDVPKENSLLIFDLAVPRDVDSAVEKFDNVTLYNLEQIEEEIGNNVSSRKQEMEKAEEIIAFEVGEFMQWQQKNSRRYGS